MAMRDLFASIATVVFSNKNETARRRKFLLESEFGVFLPKKGLTAQDAEAVAMLRAHNLWLEKNIRHYPDVEASPMLVMRVEDGWLAMRVHGDFKGDYIATAAELDVFVEDRLIGYYRRMQTIHTSIKRPAFRYGLHHA